MWANRPCVFALAWCFVFVPATGCARTHLFYDTREIRHAPVQDGQKRALVQSLHGKLHNKEIVWVGPDGRAQTLQGDEQGLRRLGMPELGALWLALSSGDVGGESDLRVQLPGGRSAPVSVLIDLRGNIRLLSPRAKARPPLAATLTEAEIRTRFSLREPLPGKWEPAERRALTEALAMLSVDELLLVRPVRFARKAKSADGDPARAALFEMRGCDTAVTLFSSGISTNRYRFVGDVTSPSSATLHSLLHEIGHAVAAAPARQAFCTATQKHGDKRNEWIHKGNRWTQEGPVLEAYRAALAGQPAPTDYGNTSLHESFAESFALFHVDNDALRRTRPSLHTWFSQRGHLRSLSPTQADPQAPAS